MSGGEFDYAYINTIQFAEDLTKKLEAQNSKTNPDDIEWSTHFEWSPEVRQKMVEIAAYAEYVGLLMKEVEWLYSSDIGEETFLQNISEIEALRGVLKLEHKP